MGAMSGDMRSETASRSGEDSAETFRSLSDGKGGPSSRSSQLVVRLPPEGSGDSRYHTTRLCPGFPAQAESVPRTVAEEEGHSFCWTCFELEMRALAEW